MSDLTDLIDPGLVFENVGGEWYCQGCAPEGEEQ